MRCHTAVLKQQSRRVWPSDWNAKLAAHEGLSAAWLQHGPVVSVDARISEVLMLRPSDIYRQALVLPNLKSPSRLVKTAHLSPARAGLARQ